MIYLQRLIKVMFFVILPILLPDLAWADVGWLNGDPNAIWSRSPGFYKDGDQWYAIIHAKPAVTRGCD